MTRLQTRASEVKWNDLKLEVGKHLDVLRMCWEGTEKGDPKIHAMLVRDLYTPLLRQLAEFCASIDVQTEPRQ